jgi:hypothetical protein
VQSEQVWRVDATYKLMCHKEEAEFGGNVKPSSLKCIAKGFRLTFLVVRLYTTGG